MFIVVNIKFIFMSTENYSPNTVHLKSSISKTKGSTVVCLKQFALLHCLVSSSSSAWQIEAVDRG